MKDLNTNNYNEQNLNIQNEDLDEGLDLANIGVKEFKRFQRWQIVSIFLVMFDIISVGASYFLALLIRFDFRYSKIDGIYLKSFLVFFIFYAFVLVVVFQVFKLYNSMWLYASFEELIRLIYANSITIIIHVIGITFLFHRMPLAYYVFGGILQFLITTSIRYSYRFIRLLRSYRKNQAYPRILLIGAGSAGQMILRDINKGAGNGGKVVAIIDDDKNKWNRFIDGVKIVGGRDDILKAVEEYHIEKIFIAIPSMDATTKRDIINICQNTDCEIKTIPGVYQFVKGEISVKTMQDVSVEDLLGREPIKADMSGVFKSIKGKTVLVTGGGGSIGSELCRQVAKHDPKCLIIFDIYENNAYSIQLELKDKYPELHLETIIGSVRDSRRVMEIFERFKPDIVYHAAAHKHVPLMEDSPCESIKNNVIGTYKTAYAAMVHGCSRFVLISTDKAVNPTNIMGASKRLCEMVIQSFDRKIKAGKADEIPQLFTHDSVGEIDDLARNFNADEVKTQFVAVRFGNVLGSNGSVIPLFKKQIAAGGPVTVTHPDIIRYFMTIPEAVSLVMLAGNYANGGEIFVLDMGSPVKIVDLARNMIKLSGKDPDKDVKIEFTGLRPGEKLFEEKLMAEEGLEKTANELIFIGKPIEFDADHVINDLARLMKMAYVNDETNIKEKVAKVVGTYKV